jgi:DNA polymerase (family X)
VSARTKVALSRALAASLQFTARLRALPFVERAEAVGSVRRHEPMIGDLDFVYIGKLDPAEVLARAAREADAVTQSGDDRAFGVWDGWAINLWRTTVESWGAAMFAWTGPQKYVIGYRMKAKRAGMLLNERGLFRNGVMLAGATEEDVVRALGKELKAPELRGK